MYVTNQATPYFRPAARRLKVVSIEFKESGTYNDMYLRSLVTRPVSDVSVNMIQQRIDHVGLTSNYDPAVFSGIASNILEFSATPSGKVLVPNGWGTSRYNFILTVASEGGNLQSKEFFIMQGYTDFCDASRSGYLDPNMTLYINSYIAVSRTSDGVSEYDRITSSGQMLNSEFTRSSFGNEACTIRPGDIFAGIQTEHITNYSDVGGQWDPSSHHDTRYRFGADSKFSSRATSVPSNYLANVMSSYATAQAVASYGGEQDTIFGKASQIQYANTVSDNPFITFISNLKGVGTCSCSFRLSDLSAIGDGMPTPIFRKASGRALAGLPVRGNAQTWNVPDMVTQMAVYLANTVSSLAMGLLITRLQFTSSNLTLNGTVDTRIIDARSPSQSSDMVMLGNLFIHRFNTEIVPDFASNEYATNIPYTLTMDIDAFGSTSIQISYDGSPVTPYVTPSFCDSLLAPVVTPTLKGFSNIVHDMDMILNQVDFTTGNMNNRVSVQVPGTANFQTLF